MANFPVHARFDGPIVMIGFGSIGRGTLPLLERHIAFDRSKFVVIDPVDTDRKLLDLLQRDASLSLDELSARAALSRNACWRRIKRLEDDGVIKARVTLLGEAALCGRYAAALKLAGIETELAGADATTRGQWQLAYDAGLVKEEA